MLISTALLTMLQSHERAIQLYTVSEDKVTSIKDILPTDIASFKGTVNVHQDVYLGGDLIMKSLSCLECVNCQKFWLGTLSYSDSGNLDSGNHYDPDAPENGLLLLYLSTFSRHFQTCQTTIRMFHK